MRILIIIFLLITFFSCKKQENENPDMCGDSTMEYISPSIYDAKFKMGTYWVYIDSLTNQIDTMKIINISADGFYGNTRCENQKHEYYAFQVDKSFASGSGDIYSLRRDGIMLNQTEELGNNYIYASTFTKIDSLFIYDRYYKSVVKTTRYGVTTYFNLSYGLLRIDSNGRKRLLKDKFIVR